jgi:SSS family solute:Na+ symporter
VAGVATVAYITLSGTGIGTLFPGLPQAVKDLNVGIVALAVNLVVTLAVSAFPPKFFRFTGEKNSPDVNLDVK